MSAELPFVSDIETAHREAIANINRWRGHCIELFARMELALGETLAANQRTVPQAISAKLDAVAELLGSKNIAKSLERVRCLADHRNLIVHGTSSVWIDANDNWLWAYRLIPTGKGKAPVEGHWDRAEAEDFEKQLSAACRSLCDQLRSSGKHRLGAD